MHALIISLSILSGTANPEGGEPAKISAETQVVLERVDSAGEWVSPTLEKLADKLGTTVDHLWPTFVREVYITGFMNIVSGIIVLVFGIILCLFLRRLRDRLIKEHQEGGRRDYWPEGAVVSQIVAFTCLLVGFIIFACMLVPGVISMVAPEPEALHNITNAIGRLK